MGSGPKAAIEGRELRPPVFAGVDRELLQQREPDDRLVLSAPDS